MTYRRDIDGLRALAVLPVVFFHLGWGAPGGYVGVDVFFVISGFLIGSIVIREIETGSFSLLRFWERRVRRILPALTAVVVATAIAGLIWMIPAHLEDLGKSIMAQPALVANVYFWQESGYFETAAEYQPLLQTWSLAVEEQFYLFFPLVMILLFKLGRRLALIGVLSFVAVSLAWSIIGTKSHPSLAFYLLPSRIWELDLGVVLALLRVKGERPRWMNETLSWSGIACILLAVFTFDLYTAFPGYSALLPCLGAALVIFGNAQEPTSSATFLGWQPIRFIGLISYSLYLWHWPLIVFARYQSVGEISSGTKLAILLLSFVLAILSWRFVERPFRKAKDREAKNATRRVLAIGAVASIMTLGLGAVFSETEGLPGRFSEETLALGRVDSPFTLMRSRDSLKENGTLPLVGAPPGETSTPPILVWGDSHAISVLSAFDDLGKKHGTAVYAAVQPSTPPLVGTWTPRIGHEFLDWGDAVLAQVESLEIKKVIFVGRWDIYLKPMADGDRRNLISDKEGSASPKEVFEAALRSTIERLRKSGVEIWFVEDVPIQPHSVPETVMLASIQGRDLNGFAGRLESHEKANREIIEIIDRSLAGLPVKRLDPLPLITDPDGIIPMVREGKALYADDHHLSPFGAAQLEPLFEPIFLPPAP